jgi:co-chaperonin GroES (HSP10)
MGTEGSKEKPASQEPEYLETVDSVCLQYAEGFTETLLGKMLKENEKSGTHKGSVFSVGDQISTKGDLEELKVHQQAKESVSPIASLREKNQIDEEADE